ncbi:MAG TPA: HAD family hydrolase, partial [Firmicutes bacterium]|nr:HAD family hydrolase [Bacillota bacterium]
MTNKCLIAIDLDGTLLDSKYQLSDYTAHILNVLRQQGHEIVLASGRL